ncbi:MAG: CBS domain-containing protein [Terracidiphilus sp.]|nr:CBS domain-containing protein [Terracidiphilus sp.]
MKITDTIEMVLKTKSPSLILSIAPNQTVYEAIQMLARHDVGALMVLDGGKLAGILSERDYARKGVLHGHPSKETLVSQIMTSPVVAVAPTQTVDECMALMTERHIRHLPVVEGEAVVGMVSIGDLVRWIIGGQEKTIQELASYIAGSYPA